MLSDLQYYRIRLPNPLKPGAQQTLGITYYFLRAYRPLPASIKQEDQQFLQYSFSAYCPSAYTTAKQKTEVKLGSANVPDYTKLPGGKGEEFPQKQGAKLTYGPFDEKPAGAVEPVDVRFEFTKPVNHVSLLTRDVEVSHWGGNVAFEENCAFHYASAARTPTIQTSSEMCRHLASAATSVKHFSRSSPGIPCSADGNIPSWLAGTLMRRTSCASLATATA
jgi:oligosaccharyltransferase complex subunit alpha (ribophorin I)